MILPIGQYAGATGDGTHQVRRGAVTERLDGDEFAVWGLGHGPLDPVLAATLPWTRTELVRYAELAGLPEADQAVTELSGRGLMVEVDPAGADAAGFARSHRAVPLAVGLGNHPDQPERFTIGLFDRSLIEVDELRYEVWCWSEAYRTLWEVCQARADDAGHGEDPAGILAHFLGGIHQLAAANALYLEVVTP